jgi:hypothetical protein
MTILDHGSLELIESWGSDERIIESARMSTGKGFLGWGPMCGRCSRLASVPGAARGARRAVRDPSLRARGARGARPEVPTDAGSV